MLRLLTLILAAMAGTGCARTSENDGDTALFSTVNEQLLLLATVVGAVAALPALIEFLVERRKRRERIALSLEDVEVATLKPRLAGMDDLLAGIADLIDRARHPKEYASLEVGNEILIVGPSLSGKKTLAHVIAKQAQIERLVTVYNPRNPDALAKAKSIIGREHDTKMMLLLPRVDQAFEKEDEEVLTELEALIETTSEKANVLVVGTATSIVPNGPLDNLFGIKLVLPGVQQREAQTRSLSPEVRRVLSEATRFYLAEAFAKGFELDGLTEQHFVERVLEEAGNPAEVQDIVTLCQTSALHQRRTGKVNALRVTPEMLEVAMTRVVVRPSEAE